MSKKLLAAVAFSAAVLGSATAFAADVGAPSYNWSGGYIGVQGGGSWGNVGQIIPNYGSVPDGDVSGLVLGGYAGYRAQLDTIVLGLEVGANWRDVDGTNGVNNAPEKLKTKQTWDGSVVGQIGLPVDSMLLYGLGGATVSDIKSRYQAPSGNSPYGSDTVWGWTVGAGVEAALTDSIHARVEYRYADYGRANVTCSSCGPTKIDLTTHTVTAGVSFNF